MDGGDEGDEGETDTKKTKMEKEKDKNKRMMGSRKEASGTWNDRYRIGQCTPVESLPLFPSRYSDVSGW